MTNHEFNEASDKVRNLCDDMSVRQMRDLIGLIEHDIETVEYARIQRETCLEQNKP